MEDLISRQALLESIERISVKGKVLDDDWIYRFIQELPSAQSEPLTHKEQRIFLAAMGRKREVCKQVDEEWSGGEFGDLYETVNLERVCIEIERKVKGALWT